MKTVVLKDDVSFAAKIIKDGGLAAVPTETVYGLAANGLDEVAVEKVYEAKGRPEKKPVSLFVTDMVFAEKFCRDIPKAAYRLAEKYWPGPLTMILSRKENVPDIITSGGEKVGIRCPDNEFVLEIIRQTGLPVTGTSANLSGMPDAVTFEEVSKYLNGKVECIVDGGKCPGGVPSTVVDMTVEPPVVIRQGIISEEDILKIFDECKMTVVGITGGTGAGKTTALDVLERMGACIIDCDAVYHDLLENSSEMMSEIKDCFPGAFPDGVFARKELGKIVFSSPEKLEVLNGITGKYVTAAVCDILSSERMNGRTAAAIDAIGLFESRLNELCDFNVAVIAPAEKRIKRIMRRENISREYAQLRVSAQKADSYFTEQCDYVLVNDFDTREEFDSHCENFFSNILRRN